MAIARLDRHEVDLTKGPIFTMLIRFAVPFIIANVLSLLFQVADVATLRFLVGGEAVGAVTSTGPLTGLFINFFIGFSAGASVVLSRCVGENDINKARRVVGTAISFSLIAGAFIMIVGWFGAETFLTWMDCPIELLPKATSYVRIYFLGAPIILFYNLGAGMLRAVGDSLRPMIYLAISGIANVGLNVFFILVCNMTVEGVAIGTVVSQLISSILMFIAMRKSKGFSRLEFKYLKIFKKELSDIVKIGLPTGIQSSLFSISNILIQSTVNSFGPVAVEGSGAAGHVDGFIYVIGNAVGNSSMSFVSQNYGAKNVSRIKKVILISTISVVIFQFLIGSLVYLLSRPILSLLIATEEAYFFANQRLVIMLFFYFIEGVLEVLSLSLRAVGKSTTSMLISVIFVCVFRIVWLKTFFLLNPVPIMIFLSYPISWILSNIAFLTVLVPLLKKLKIKFDKEKIESLEQTEVNV